MDQGSAPQTQTNMAAIGSLVAGIVGLIVLLVVSIPIGIILALVGLGLSGVGRAWAGSHGGSGQALAIAGLVVSFITIGLSLLGDVLGD